MLATRQPAMLPSRPQTPNRQQPDAAEQSPPGRVMKHNPSDAVQPEVRGRSASLASSSPGCPSPSAGTGPTSDNQQHVTRQLFPPLPVRHCCPHHDSFTSRRSLLMWQSDFHCLYGHVWSLRTDRGGWWSLRSHCQEQAMI